MIIIDESYACPKIMEPEVKPVHALQKMSCHMVLDNP